MIDRVFKNTIITPFFIDAGKYCPWFKYRPNLRGWCHDREKREQYKRLSVTDEFINVFLKTSSDEDEGNVI